MRDRFGWPGYCHMGYGPGEAIPFHDPLLLFIYRVAFLLAIPGMIAALAGIWKPGPLRWHAPLCVAGTTFFWLMVAASE